MEGAPSSERISTRDRFREVFSAEKPIIAMLHVWDESPEQVAVALRDLEILNPLVDGVIVENYGWGYRDSNHSQLESQTAIARITTEVIANADVPVGINMLPNDYEASMRIASETGGRFIQMDHIIGNFRHCQPVDVAYLRKVRSQYPDIVVLGGIHPKYYELEEPAPEITDSARQAAGRGDGVVVTGTATGMETNLDELAAVREVLESTPLVIGSGLTPENAPDQLAIADGAIVGSSIKIHGVRPGEPVNQLLVERLMDKVRSS